MHLKRELQSSCKGAKLMQEYLSHAKQLRDNLAAFGEHIIDADLQQIILIGLDTTYDPIVAVLTAILGNNIPMDDFQAHLFAFDQRIEAQNALLQHHPVANIATQHRFDASFMTTTGWAAVGTIAWDNEGKVVGAAVRRFKARSAKEAEIVAAEVAILLAKAKGWNVVRLKETARRGYQSFEQIQHVLGFLLV
ncbi:hypothetical protein IFM89_021529 [Coptis chinensis]|uniref:Uncharacterized protein n=1 Tax=Coptis chinensis TaxID=261450 RepID=A0A835M9K0_9MAGN|nr:hypothetical protein IFM89_021529 [Coptis chinensis]